jgi:ABC-type glycerol-3-phosphate transport system substrate-binding protein
MNMTPFQYAVLGLFIFFLIAGVSAFALYRGGAGAQLSQVTLWGTFDEQTMLSYYDSPALKSAGVTVQYIPQDAATFDQVFVEALASGNAPDLALLPGELLYRMRNKVLPIPYESVPERTFRDTFADSAEIFLGPEGIYGIPFVSDPLVMYYNRDLIAGKGLAQPPQYWDEFITIAPKFNERNNAGNLSRSLVALGETVNVTNYKEILTALFLQAGTPITRQGTAGMEAVLSNALGQSTSPGEAALRFYTIFADPANAAYSWNKSMLDSRDAFVAGDVATYLGFASELWSLRSRNPNLNFDVTTLPQIRNGEFQATAGRLYALIIPKSSKNPSAAAAAALTMAGNSALSDFAARSYLPPARRDMLGVAQTDPFKAVFYKSAVLARSFIDPSPLETKRIFADMVEAVISGEARIDSALGRANQEIEALLQSVGR